VGFPGTIYHVLNRGNYRQDLFETAGATQAFVDRLWEACDQAKWRLHAYCLMKNHSHLAIETLSSNLVEADRKVGLARWIMSITRVSNRWLTDRLSIGAPNGVSRYCLECREGRRTSAVRCFNRLTTNIRG